MLRPPAHKTGCSFFCIRRTGPPLCYAPACLLTGRGVLLPAARRRKRMIWFDHRTKCCTGRSYILQKNHNFHRDKKKTYVEKSLFRLTFQKKGNTIEQNKIGLMVWMPNDKPGGMPLPARGAPREKGQASEKGGAGGLFVRRRFCRL